jgi:hypothetical protein
MNDETIAALERAAKRLSDQGHIWPPEQDLKDAALLRALAETLRNGGERAAGAAEERAALTECERKLLLKLEAARRETIAREVTARDAGAAEERAKIVAWLREQMPSSMADLQYGADAIEAGAHVGDE